MRLGEDRAGTSALVLRLSGSVNVNTIHNTIAYFMTQEEELTWLIFGSDRSPRKANLRLSVW